MIGLRSIVVNIALITTAILRILHVISTFVRDLQLRNFHGQLSIVGLLIVSVHCEFGQDGLVTVDSKGLWN